MTIRSKLRWAFLFLIIFSFISCIGITLHDVANLRIGMNDEEAQAVLNESPDHVFTLEITGHSEKIDVHSYTLRSGDYMSDYFLAFQDNRLLFWGYPHEYARSKDPFLNEIGQKAVKASKEVEPY